MCSLSDALAQEPRHFPRLYVSMVRAGEAAGHLDKSLRELAELRERTEALQAKLTSALIYPVILVLTAVGAVTMLLTLVVPQFAPMFAQAGEQLPAGTRIVLAVPQCRARQRDGAILVVLLLAAGRPVAPVAPGRAPAALRPLRLGLPGFGPFLRERLTAQLSRGLATLLAGGLDLPQALVMTRGMLANREAQARMEQVIQPRTHGPHAERQPEPRPTSSCRWR